MSPLNIHAWRGFPLRDRLADLAGLPVAVDNDAKALALGEGWVGAARGCDDYLAMVVSTGVGGGIVLDGRLLDGTGGNAGHIGHVVVEPEGRPCVCGGQGCLEAEVSGTAIAAMTGKPAAEADLGLRRHCGTLVGRAVASVACLLDLQLAVVAGSVALGFGDDFFAAARRRTQPPVRARLRPDDPDRTGRPRWRRAPGRGRRRRAARLDRRLRDRRASTPGREAGRRPSVPPPPWGRMVPDGTRPSRPLHGPRCRGTGRRGPPAARPVVDRRRGAAAHGPPLWWRTPPHLPLPDRRLWEFRMVTAYGRPDAVPDRAGTWSRSSSGAGPRPPGHHDRAGTGRTTGGPPDLPTGPHRATPPAGGARSGRRRTARSGRR